MNRKIVECSVHILLTFAVFVYIGASVTIATCDNNDKHHSHCTTKPIRAHLYATASTRIWRSLIRHPLFSCSTVFFFIYFVCNIKNQQNRPRKDVLPLRKFGICIQNFTHCNTFFTIICINFEYKIKSSPVLILLILRFQ